MLITKEQAAATWCPMVRIARHEVINQDTGNYIVGGCNTDALGRLRVPASCCCVADKCAMWRWAGPAPQPIGARTWWPKEDEPTVEPPRPTQVPLQAEWVPLTGEGEHAEGGCWQDSQQSIDADNAAIARERQGYCGLAGKPVV